MVVGSAPGALASKDAKLNIPVVFAAVTDPFEHGLIASLAHPGGNITGVSLAVGEGFSGKWVELLKETVPKLQGSLSYGIRVIPSRKCSRERPRPRPERLAWV